MEQIPDSNLSIQNNIQENLNYNDYQDYYLMKENIIYKIIIEKDDEDIFIKCKNYLISINQNELSLLSKIQFNSLNKAYEFIFNLFEENKVIIQNVLIIKEIALVLKISTEKEIELILKYNYTKNNISINADLKEIVNEIKKLKEENEVLKSEINQLKNYHENNNKNNPNNIKLFSNIINDSVSTVSLSNSFIVFKAINNILYLIYGNKNKSIICYNLNEKRKIQELKNYHNEIISFFQHYLDEINKRDLLMSASHKDNNIRIFNLNNWQCILNLSNINKEGNLFSACFLNKDNNIYIITSNSNTSKNGISEHIKIYDFHVKK